MPERPYRLAELRQHATGTYAIPIDPQRDRLVAEHPDWPICSVCRWPIDPAAGGDGTAHPNCITETPASAEPADPMRRR